MRAVLNHSEMEVRSQKPQGIGIVKKETLPTYRMAELAKSQMDQSFDPTFKAKLDTLFQTEIDKIVYASKP